MCSGVGGMSVCQSVAMLDEANRIGRIFHTEPSPAMHIF